MELWVKKSVDLDVSLPPQWQRGKLTSGGLGSVGGRDGGAMGCGRAVEAGLARSSPRPIGSYRRPRSGYVKGCNLKPMPLTLVLTENTMPQHAPKTPGNL